MKKKIKLFKRFISFFLAITMIYTLGFTGIKALATTDSVNGDWTAENITLTNTSEAQLMVRNGDIDNFGFGWSSEFNPFSGNETGTHDFPFYPESDDKDGTDRIMVVSGYNYNGSFQSTNTNRDGYTEKTQRTDRNIYIKDGRYTTNSSGATLYSSENDNVVRPIYMTYDLTNISVQNATVKMFVDDFQPGEAHGIKSGTVSYKATINGQDFPELSNIINNLDQSGPRGKMITFQIPERFLYLVRTGQIYIKIDDATSGHTGDGYAIDFAKLLINKTNSTINTATISGYVRDTNNTKIVGAKVSAGGVAETLTDANGYYKLDSVPAGQAVVTASKTGYNSKSYTEATVISGGGYTHDFELTSSDPPNTPIIGVSPTTITKNNVTATVNYSTDSEIKEYRVNIGSTIGEWKAYTIPFVVVENCSIDARGTNQYGNISQIANCPVNNIDKTLPNLTLTQTPTTPTNGKVTINVTATDNVAIATTKWLAGTKEVSDFASVGTVVSGNSFTVSSNGTYTGYTVDTAGNAVVRPITITNISNMPQVKIAVTDASGTLDEYSVDSDNASKRVDKDVTTNNFVLKGDSYANFSLNSANANAFQYSIVTGNKPVDMPTTGWTTIDLQSQVINQDVVIDKQGYLTQRAYDVNHMLTLTDTTNWSNPEQVFKYPYPEIGYKSANTSTTKGAYGAMENVVPYTVTDVNNNKITVNSRWASNTAFMSNMDIFGEYKEASKFWGYISVPEDGNYILGASSDDGCRGWITVDGEAKQFTDMFYPQGVKFGTKNVTLNLKAGKYYPLYLEYFNWGGSAAFQLNYVKNQSTLTDSNKTAIPTQWFYPSKSTTPGEYAKTLFIGGGDVKLPHSAGQYYIAYRTGTKNLDNSISYNADYDREGIYGPFTVKPTAPLELTKKINSNSIVNGKSFEINYTITPKPIPIEDFSTTNTQNFEVSNLKFNESLPVGLNIDKTKLDSTKLEIALNGDDRDISGILKQTIKYELDTTKTQYVAQPISFSIWVSSATGSTYNMLGKDSYITYLDIDGGSRSANFNDLNIVVNSDNIAPILTLKADPTTSTNGKVTITAEATDSGSGVASITNLNATDVKTQGTVTNPINSVINNGIVTNADGTVIVDSIITYTVSENGTYQFTAKDNAGNITETQTITISNIDKTAPAVPVITTPVNNTVTNDNTPTISGTAEANSTVRVYDGTIPIPIGTVLADGTGHWTLIPSAALADGSHAITAIATDAAGNISPKSNIVNITIDTTAAAPVITTPADNTVTNNNKPIISGTAEANSIVKVYDGTIEPIGTANADGAGNWTLTPSTGLADGTYAITAIATDAAGNLSPVSNIVNITIDTTKPVAPVIAVPVNNTVTNDNTPTISGTAEANSTVNVYDGSTHIGRVTADVNGNWTLTPSAALADGAHAITATATDVAGNVSPVSNTVNITINTTVPATPVIVGNPDNTIIPTNNKVTVTITYPDDPTTKQYRIDGGQWENYTDSFEVTKNCTIEARGINGFGYESQIASYTVTNIASTISKHGIYDKNSTDYINNTNLSVVKTIPTVLAVLVDVKSSTVVVNLNTQDSLKIQNSIIDFKQYKISDMINPIATGTLDITDGNVVISNSKDTKCIIVYTIIPKETSTTNDTITIDAEVEGISNSNNPITLNIQALPDLF